MELIESLNLHPFSPPKVWASPHIQTVASFALPGPADLPPHAEHTIELEDEDRLLLMENLPQQPAKERIILLVHGLTGCYQSNFMIRINRLFVDGGYHCFRLNLRGCGPGWHLAKKPCNAGRSEDLRQTLKWLKNKFPNSPVTVVGFSLGANILLKMLGEDGEHSTGNIDRFAAISPPLDLRRAIDYMLRKENQIYSKFFTRTLKKDIAKFQQRFPELRDIDISHCRQVVDVDETYTAPLSGYKNADEYYRLCSSAQFLPDIRIPGLILGAYDDPVIDGSVYRNLETRREIETVFLERGGHVGFLESPFSRGNMRWMDQLVFRWERAFSGT